MSLLHGDTRRDDGHTQRRLIMANEPRLMREMLARVLGAVPGIEVAAVSDLAALDGTVAQSGADWVLGSFVNGAGVPDVLQSLLVEYPALCIMVIARDCRQARLICMAGSDPRDDVSLQDVVSALLSKTPGIRECHWPEHAARPVLESGG
jgi:hypothetical protein